jgi:acetyl esterase/lipase
MIHNERIDLPGGAKLFSYAQAWGPFPGTRVRRGAVIVCPGGGYAALSRTEGEAIALALVAQGYQAFVLKYRIQDEARWPNPLVDAAQAVAYVRDHAAEFDIFPDNIAMAGFSAGGHVSAALGTMWDRPEVQQLAGATGEQIRPNALILGYPALNLRIDRGGAEVCRTLGGDRPLDELLAETDTIAAVGANTPPTFLYSIFTDGAVPVEQGLQFCARLAAHDIPFELHTFADGEHASSLGTDATAFGGETYPHNAHWFGLCMEWLRTIFRAPEIVGTPPTLPPMGSGRAKMME